MFKWVSCTILSAIFSFLMTSAVQAQITPSAPAQLNTIGTSDTVGDFSPQITTDGAGNWVAVWESLENLDGTTGTDSDIFVSTSADDGSTWSAPALLNTNGTSDTGRDWAPQVTTDGAGNWVATWHYWNVLPRLDIFVATSTNNGTTWSAPAKLYTNGNSDSQEDWDPQITTDSLGNWVAVWASSENLAGTAGTDWDVFVATSTNNGNTWSTPALLNTNGNSDTEHDWEPQVTTDGAGNWVATWMSRENLNGTAGTDDDIFVATSTNNGGTWSTPALLNSNGNTDTGWDQVPQVTTDGAGNWVAVWASSENLAGTAGTDYDIFVATSTNNGGTWSAPALLNSNGTADTGWDQFPQVTTDGTGNWVATWESGENLAGTAGTDLDVFVATSTNNGGTWSAPALLNSNGTSDTKIDQAPQVTTDGAGNWVATWESEENLAGTAGTDFDIFVATSKNNGDTWSTPALLNTNGNSDTLNDSYPQITTDGAGNWVATWHSRENLNGTAGTDDDIFVTTSLDNGGTWSTPTLLNSNGTSDNSNGTSDTGADTYPQITTDGAGKWLATWSSSEDLGGTAGTDNDIFVATSTNNGGTWTDPALLNTNATSDAEGDNFPQITTDGVGNWVAVWRSSDNFVVPCCVDSDIFVATSSDNGSTWSNPALLNTNGVLDQLSVGIPQVTTDGNGNWVATWASGLSLDPMIGTETDIYFATSSDNGGTWSDTTLLNTNGNSDTRVDTSPQITTDSAGNWVAVWRSRENLNGTAGTDDDIFVATSTNNGGTWSAPALLNTNGTSDTRRDMTPQVTTDGVGNWVAMWESSENLDGLAGIDNDIFVAISSDNGSTWSSPALFNTNGNSDTGRDFVPQVTTDGAGNWIATWASGENLDGTAGTDDDIFVATFIFTGVPDLSASTSILLILLTVLIATAGVFVYRRKTVH